MTKAGKSAGVMPGGSVGEPPDGGVNVSGNSKTKTPFSNRLVSRVTINPITIYHIDVVTEIRSM